MKIDELPLLDWKVTHVKHDEYYVAGPKVKLLTSEGIKVNVSLFKIGVGIFSHVIMYAMTIDKQHGIQLTSEQGDLFQKLISDFDKSNEENTSKSK